MTGVTTKQTILQILRNTGQIFVGFTRLLQHFFLNYKKIHFSILNEKFQQLKSNFDPVKRGKCDSILLSLNLYSLVLKQRFHWTTKLRNLATKRGVKK